MGGPTDTEPSAAPRSPESPERSGSAPKSIGRYEVERLVGQGGMGRVWLARDTVLGRKVAIKVLRDDLALPPPVRDELVVRMGHEARAAAAVSHPNIVTLHDMGEDDDVGLFLVFEYVTTRRDDTELPPDGGADDDPQIVLSLRDRLKRGPLPFAEVAKLARDLGSALTYAHEAGVIHRDVKPENILFSRSGFKIADFGIARIPDSTITRANTVLGTPAYTAPEALSKGDFGPASDQFSFAATLYEAATGGRAFAGEDAIVTAGKVSSEPPPPLHESIGPDGVVRALDLTLQRGLAKEPEARFATCAELGQEVARAIEAGAAPRRVTGGRSASHLTPVPGLIEIERTPLSSRMAIAERAMHEYGAGPASGETPRPSIFLRRRTHRFQNIAAGVALVVIVALILLGRRTPGRESAASTSAEPPSAAPAPPPPPAPRPHVRPTPPAHLAPSPPGPRGTAAPGDAAAPDDTAAPRGTAAPGDTAAPRDTAPPGDAAPPRDPATQGDTATPRAAAPPGDAAPPRATATPGE
ncbi:MAG: serine/threonine protein kinase [Labilithrix sp.]|nr:serine/threonine protein kinase [Labilithrix sp.]